MNRSIVCLDQTLSEAIRLKISPSGLLRLVRILRQLPLDLYDVWVQEWLPYNWIGVINNLYPYLRGRIAPSLSQLHIAAEKGFKKIIVVYHHSPGSLLDQQVIHVLQEAADMGLTVSLEISNASELSLTEVARVAALLHGGAVESLIYSDAAGIMDPFAAYEAMNTLGRQKGSPILEYHGHNHYGLATANCLGALQGGAERVAVSVAGVGSKGHPACEEVLLAAGKLLGISGGSTNHLAAYCSQALACMGLQVPSTKAVIGPDIFAHESGIHADGVLKQPELYEAFSPAAVGLSRRLVVGKHSGTALIKAKFAQWDIGLSQSQAEWIVKKVRELAVAEKRPVSDKQLKQLYGSIFSADMPAKAKEAGECLCKIG